jgi:GTPase SAR1 family protein
MELKTVIIGETDVGKTSLSSRFCHGGLPALTTPTIGASFLQKRIDVQVDGEVTEVVLQLWDTGGCATPNRIVGL